jgi:hypothetical protein
MIDYLFPVEYKKNDHWDVEMIEKWIKNQKVLLSFSFNRFCPRYLPGEPFWLYLYYTKSSTEEREWKGKLRYRFWVIEWQYEKYCNDNVYTFPSTLCSTIWFLCNRYEEVRREDGRFLSYEDFRHPQGKSLGSCLRSSIAPAICKLDGELYISQTYPSV